MKKVSAAFLTVMTLFLLSAVIMVAGCSSSSNNDTSSTATVSSIAVTPATASLTAVGHTQQFTATATLSDSTTNNISTTATWHSSNTAVATISATGLATAVGAGSTNITAASGTVTSNTATLTVTITPAATTYSATLYMASEGGGHVGVYPVTIDPSNTTSPITVDTANVKKIQLAGSPGNPATKIVFHDLRLDGNKLYYSGFMSQPSNTAVANIGYVDLTLANNASTNNAKDSTIDIDAPAADTIAFALNAMGVGSGLRILYCGSGIDADTYYPMSMSFPAYIDAVPRVAIDAPASHVTASTTGFHRTYIENIDADAAGWARINGSGGADLGSPPLAFLHGNTNADGTKMMVSTNVVSGLTTTNNLAGIFRAYLIPTAKIKAGTMTTADVISKGSYTVAPSLASIAYRGSFTPDSKYYLQSGADRMLIIDTTTNPLTAHDTDTDTVKIGGGKTGIENHDVMTTPDGKYALLAIRYFDAPSDTYKSSGVQLYDIANKKFIGGIATTCGSSAAACHPAGAGDTANRPTCGLVGKFQ